MKVLTPGRVAATLLAFGGLLALAVAAALVAGPSGLGVGEVVAALRGDARLGGSLAELFELLRARSKAPAGEHAMSELRLARMVWTAAEGVKGVHTRCGTKASLV